jgi:hypothetical protein
MIKNALWLQLIQRLSTIAFAAVMAVFAYAPDLSFAEPPASKEDFDKRYAEEGKTPEGALKLWFDGVFLYHDKSTRDLGIHILTQTTKEYEGSSDWETRSSSATFVTRMRNAGDMHIFRSYAKSATPDNAYQMDVKTYELNILDSDKDPYSESHTIKLTSSGADNPRLVYLELNPKTGLWRLTRFSNIYVGVRKPVAP